MEVASVALAVPPIAILIWEQWVKIAEIMGDMEHAPDEVRESLTSITTSQLEYESIKQWIDWLVKNPPSSLSLTRLDEPLDQVHGEVSIIVAIVEELNNRLNSTTKSSVWSTQWHISARTSYAFRKKKAIKAATKSLEQNFQRLSRILTAMTIGRSVIVTSQPVLPSQLQETRISDRIKALRTTIEARVSNKTTSILITDSLAITKPIEEQSDIYKPDPDAYTHLDLSKVNCLIEYKIKVVNGERSAADISELTFALSKVDPANMPGMLQCRGFCEDNQKNRYELRYDMPSADYEQSPSSLRSILPASAYAGRTCHPLEQRCRFANNVAKALLFIHCNQIIHKGICPEHIIMFYAADKTTFKQRETSLPAPYLLGFGDARFINDTSELVGSASVAKNLYRHPLRQGLSYADKYTILDDIYAFGVILLEIGMWRSLLAIKRDKTGTTFSIQRDSSGVEEVDIHLWRSVKAVPDASKKLPSTYEWKNLPGVFRRMAKKQVSVVLGARFVRIIETCLSCLEEQDRTEGGNRLWEAHEKGVAEVSLVFEEHVLFELEQVEQALSLTSIA